MKKLTQISVLILIINFQFLTFNCEAQDIHFSQFRMTPLQLDPSQAGNAGNYRAIINYRNQWGSLMSTPYTTYGGSFDMRLGQKENKDNFLGAGISVYNDKAGEINLGTTLLNLTLAYHLKVNSNSYLSAGIQGGISQRSLEVSNLRFDDQYDGTSSEPTLPSNEVFQNSSLILPNLGVGISYKYNSETSDQVGNNVNVGAAVYHIASPDYSFLENDKSKLMYRYVLHANTSFEINNTNLAIQPSGYVYYQGGAIDFVAGTYLRYSFNQLAKDTGFMKGAALSIGAHIRPGDAFIPSILLEAGSFALGLSYDINVSGLSAAGANPGGFEIALRFLSPNSFGKGNDNRARFN